MNREHYNDPTAEMAIAHMMRGEKMARAFAKSFYKSKEWQKARAYALLRDKYVCKKCGAVAVDVHHIVHLSPKNINDPSISLSPNNLISLCKECHFKEHQHGESDAGNDFQFDEHGQIVRAPHRSNPLA